MPYVSQEVLNYLESCLSLRHKATSNEKQSIIWPTQTVNSCLNYHQNINQVYHCSWPLITQHSTYGFYYDGESGTSCKSHEISGKRALEVWPENCCFSSLYPSNILIIGFAMCERVNGDLIEGFSSTLQMLWLSGIFLLENSTRQTQTRGILLCWKVFKNPFLCS